MNSWQRLTALSTTLGLQDVDQDWGIINADAERLDEFIAFFKDKKLVNSERVDMLGLILASANELLLKSPDDGLVEMDELLHAYPAVATVHVEYWKSLDDADFPLGAWLRSHGHGSSSG
jgi:hypothetical protein